MINLSKHKYLIFIGIAILVFILMRLIDFNGLYGQDSHEYLRYSKHLKNSLISLHKPDNYFWPVMYPLIGGLLSLTSIPEVYMLQFISIFAYGITAYYILKILDLLYKKSSIIYVVIFFLLSPMVFRLGNEIMSDMLCLSFLTTGFYHLLKYNSLNKFHSLLYSVLLFSLAFHTRYVSGLIFIIPFFMVFFKNIRKQPVYKYVLLIVAAIVVSIPHILIKSVSIDTFAHSWLLNWDLRNFFQYEFITSEGLRSYKLSNLIFVITQSFHPRYFFFGVILIFFSKVKDFKVLLLASILPYLIFLSGIPFQNSRFILLPFFLFLILFFPAFNRILEKLKTKKNVLFLSVAIIQVLLSIYSFSKVYDLNKEEKRNVMSINKISSHKTIYTSGYEGPLRSYSDKNIYGLWLDSISNYKSGLLMINDLDMKDKNLPSTIKYNYNTIKNNYKIKKLKTFEKGWKLYEVQ